MTARPQPRPAPEHRKRTRNPTHGSRCPRVSARRSPAASSHPVERIAGNEFAVARAIGSVSLFADSMPRGKSGGLPMRNTGSPAPREAACTAFSAVPSLQAHRDLRRTAPDESSFFDRIGVDDRLIARTRYQLQFDLLLQELDASKLLPANSILCAGLPDNSLVWRPGRDSLWRARALGSVYPHDHSLDRTRARSTRASSFLARSTQRRVHSRLPLPPGEPRCTEEQ